MGVVLAKPVVPRGVHLFRKRWDSDHLNDLAVREHSFVAEYRVDPGGFSILHELLDPMLQVNENMASHSQRKIYPMP